MNTKCDIQIAFQMSEFKFVFTEFILKQAKEPLKLKLKITDLEKENIYKDLIYSSKRISITYFDNRFWKNNIIKFSEVLFNFFDFLYTNFKIINTDKFLVKIIFNSETGNKLCFLFDVVPNIDFLKKGLNSIIKKIENYKKGDVETFKEIKGAFKLKSKEVYFEFKNDRWCIINLIFNAGKYHHDNIAKNITDTRIAKPDILIDKGYLNNTIKYKALWKLEANKRQYIRVKPKDIALYSNIAMTNLKKAKNIYEDEKSVLWKYIQMPDDEQKFIDYYELIITSIILSYSSIEALINILIPRNYVHKRREKNKITNRLKAVKYSKEEIERWFTLDDKMNVILPEALNIVLPKHQKWWVFFKELKKLRNKIVHSVDSKSNERYSEFLGKEIFRIVESHIDVIKFFGNWATEGKHYMLNELPYGFGYDDIVPSLISSQNYNQVERERRGIK